MKEILNKINIYNIGYLIYIIPTVMIFISIKNCIIADIVCDAKKSANRSFYGSAYSESGSMSRALVKEYEEFRVFTITKNVPYIVAGIILLWLFIKTNLVHIINNYIVNL